MLTIEKRSNLTRIQERPPTTIHPASAAFLAEIQRLAVKSTPRPGAPVRRSRETRWAPKEPAEAGQPAAPRLERKAAPGSPPARLPARPLPAQNTPAWGGRWNAMAVSGSSLQPAHPAGQSWNPARPGRVGPPGAAARLPQLPATPQERGPEPRAPRPETQEQPPLLVEAPPEGQAAPQAGEKKPAPPPLSLEQLLARYPGLPAQTAILGISDDTLPVLLDLNDAAPGAVLAIGDRRGEQLQLLQTAVTSLVRRNAPSGIQFLVISNDAGAWQAWVQRQGYQRYCLAVEAAGSAMLADWVLRLADWTEQRRLGQREGPPILLVMDTLNFLPRLADDLRLNFEWLAREGPQARIWPLATVSTDLARVLAQRRLLGCFQTRVLGCAADPAVELQAAGLEDLAGFTLTRAGQYAVRVGENWLTFQLPRL